MRTTTSRQNTQLNQTLPSLEELKLELLEVAFLEIFYTINVPKCYRKKTPVFQWITFEVLKLELSRTRRLPFFYYYRGSHEHAHSREREVIPIFVSQSKCVGEGKKLRFALQMFYQFFWSFILSWDTVLDTMSAKKLATSLTGKRSQKPEKVRGNGLVQFQSIILTWMIKSLMVA